MRKGVKGELLKTLTNTIKTPNIFSINQRLLEMLA